MKLIRERFTNYINTKYNDGSTTLETIISFKKFHNRLLTLLR